MEFLLFALILGFLGVKLWFKIAEEEEAIKQVSKAQEAVGARFDGKHTLYIERQNRLIRDILLIRNHKVDFYKQDPLELHVGAVTIGGVTSGGAYTTGGGTSVTSSPSDRFELVCKHVGYVGPGTGDAVSEHIIEKIILSDELAAEANESQALRSLRCLKGNAIEVVKDVGPSIVSARVWRTGDRNAAMSLLSLEKAEGYPTREKCEAIIQLLSKE